MDNALDFRMKNKLMREEILWFNLIFLINCVTKEKWEKLNWQNKKNNELNVN